MFKATIEPPPKGNKFLPTEFAHLDRVKRNEMDDDNDDEFFHLTCHIDASLKDKIEKGEYVELEKLLPKRGSAKMGDDN